MFRYNIGWSSLGDSLYLPISHCLVAVSQSSDNQRLSVEDLGQNWHVRRIAGASYRRLLGVDVTGRRECGLQSREALLPILPSVSDLAKSSFSSRDVVFAYDSNAAGGVLLSRYSEVGGFAAAIRPDTSCMRCLGPKRC